jgi:hypothetical protein
VTRLNVADQELVVHLFAPAEGPHADEAYRRLLDLWSVCGSALGMTRAIPGTGLTTTLPAIRHDLPSGPAIAARQSDRCQAIVRRHHDVLNLSLALTSGTWAELDRLWDQDAEVFLGQTRLYLAKYSDGPVGAESLDPLLPPAPRAAGWAERGRVLAGGFALWETTPREPGRQDRRIVVLAPEDHALSAWVWSDGGVGMPPFTRCLLHAAKIRYQVRVWADGHHVARLRERVDRSINELRLLIKGAAPDRQAVADGLSRLRTDEADVVMVSARLREMRRTVEIGAANLVTSLDGDLPMAGQHDLISDDQQLAEWFVHQLDDDVAYLNSVADRAARIGEIATGTIRGLPTVAPPAAVGRTWRMGFVLDTVSFGRRSPAARGGVQIRLAALVPLVLADLDAPEGTTDVATTGDGAVVLLPVGTDPSRALPALILSVSERLALDNDSYRDRIRLRMSVGVGLSGPGALGFEGPLVVDITRLNDSAVLKGVVDRHPDADLVVLVSNRLHADVVASGYVRSDKVAFLTVDVTAKEFAEPAWLWVPKGTG